LTKLVGFKSIEISTLNVGWRSVSCEREACEVATFRDLLAEVKTQIHEVEPADAEAKLAQSTLLDVREAEEYEQGAIPGAVHIPRGFLEVQVEGRLTDKTQPVIVYCAGGTRSAFAAKSLADLGYTDVVSMAGGFNRWKDEGRNWQAPIVLTSDQRNRYQRHILLPEIAEAGQQKLLESKVLLLGAGGLGSPAALYLAAAGVGTIGIVDMDVVDASNLQRQILHNMDRVGMRKVDSAKLAIEAINPDVKVITYDVRIGADNIVDLFSGYDLVVDGTDNFPTRYLVNDASLVTNTPVVHGSIFRFEGQATVFHPHVGPCYRCIVPEPPPPELAPSCSEAGVLGVLCGIIGSIEAVEAVKMLLGIGEPLVGRLLAYDALGEEFRTFKVRRDPNCPACSDGAEIVIAEYDQLCMPHVLEPAN
jgi:molybdopterin/thiamine biosynthesis adenylyltransferase/rhodanese-related sulfurtransferase